MSKSIENHYWPVAIAADKMRKAIKERYFWAGVRYERIQFAWENRYSNDPDAAGSLRLSNLCVRAEDIHYDLKERLKAFEQAMAVLDDVQRSHGKVRVF